MPLVRYKVRNEYGLGGQELYKDAVQDEDPKPVLDGVAVAGLVGILRQLGDLAEFAAEVFHGLQEQVASTASRGRKLVTRVQRVEASLPQLEKAILSQTSHIHYAYTPGSALHARIRNEQNHFIYDDLPPFIMDSYEECREPPRLQLLDRFDTGGPGSCLKRYSDPTFFRRASASSEVRNGEKSLHERKARKIKQRRRSWKHKAHFPNCAPISKDSERMQSPSPIIQGQSSLSHTGSTVDPTFKSDMVDPSDSLGSKDGMDFIECVLHPSTSTLPDDAKNTELSSVPDEKMLTAHESIHFYGQNYGACSPTMEETVSHSSVTCDEKMVRVERMHLNYETDDLEYIPETKSDLHEQGLKTAYAECFDQVDYLNEHESPPKSNVDSHYLETAVDDFHDVPKPSIDVVKQKLRLVNANVDTADDLSEHESTTNSHVHEHYPRTILDARFTEPSELTQPDCGIGEVQDMLENFELHEHDLGPATMECIAQVADLSRGENTSKLISDGSPINDPLDRKLGTIIDAHFAEPSELNGPDCGIDEVQYMLENFELHELDFGPATMECIVQVADLSRGENTSELLSDGSPVNDPLDRKLGTSEIQHVHNTNFDVDGGELEAINMEHACQMDAFSESENVVTVIEWNQLDDMDSETDQFVDALNTIESESESDFEGQTQKELLSFSSSKGELVENAIFEQKEEIISHQEPERESYCVSNDDKEQTPDDLQNSNALVPSTNMESPGHSQSSCNVSATEIISLQEPDQECDSVSFDHKEQVPGASLDSTASLDSAALVSMKSIEHAQSSCNVAAEEIISLQEPEQECDSVSFDHKEQAPDASLDSTALLSMESIGHAQSSCNVSEAERISLQEPEDKFHDVFYDLKQQTSDDSHNSAALVSSSMMESLVHAQSFCNVSAEEEGFKLDHSACLSDEQSVQCIQSSSAPAEETIPAPRLSQGISVGPSSTYPLAFWTNGTLLGLEPSKPTVFSSANTVNSDRMSSNYNIQVGQSNPNTMQKVENSAPRVSSLKDPGCGNGFKVDKGNQDAEFSNHMSHQTSDKKYEKSTGHDLNNLADHSMIRGLNNGRIMPHETKVPSTADVKDVSAEAINTSEDKSSLITLLGRELLKNGLRAGSSDHVDKPKTTNPLHNDLENRSHAATLHSVPETISKGKSNSPVNSPPPSPPLEHMKISFRPIDGFETSRLKLKYPEGVDQHEASVDTFPSFQLIPEPSNLKPDIGSDSDDDTFCRSYACMSDDYLGHLSDSNSEELESGDTSESNDPALYDGLCRISSTEFTSSSPQCEEIAHGSVDVGSISGYAVHSGSGPSFDLPTLGTMIPFSHGETTVCLCTAELETPLFQKPTPETPPLPPLQWRVSKPLLDAEEDKQDQGSDSLYQPFYPFSISDLPKLDSAKLFGSEEPATISKTNKVADVGRADDKEDFLHHIRTKSFNLRRTETARSSYIPNNTTSNNVTAILQKANAIRQAVASDGDDDSWSDT